MHVLRILARNTERNSHLLTGNEAGEDFIPVASRVCLLRMKHASRNTRKQTIPAFLDVVFRGKEM